METCHVAGCEFRDYAARVVEQTGNRGHVVGLSDINKVVASG